MRARLLRKHFSLANAAKADFINSLFGPQEK
jgi:hypothetical protein